MKLTWRDAVGTALFALIAIPYGFYLAWGGITLIKDASGATTLGLVDPTGMAAFALVVGLVAAAVGGWIALNHGAATRYVTGGLGVISAALGVLALVGENLFSPTVWEGVLAAFVASIAALWLLATARHAGIVDSGAPEAHAGLTTT